MILCASRPKPIACFFDCPSRMLVSWEHDLSIAEEEEASSLMLRVQELRKAITGIQLVSTYVRRRVWPLRQQVHPLWRYEGCLDATRMSATELSGHEFHDYVKHITGISPVDIAFFDFSVFPYGLGTPIPEVLFDFLLAHILPVFLVTSVFFHMCLTDLFFLCCAQGSPVVTSLPPLPEHGSTTEKDPSVAVDAVGVSRLTDDVIASEAKAAEEAPLCLMTTDPVIAPTTKRRRPRLLGDVDPADADPSLVVAASSA